jgi:hypothetical protein
MSLLCAAWALWIVWLAWTLAGLWRQPVRLQIVGAEVAQLKVGKPARFRVRAFNEFDVEVAVSAADAAWASAELQVGGTDPDGSVVAVGASVGPYTMTVNAFGLTASESGTVEAAAVARLEIVVEAIP